MLEFSIEFKYALLKKEKKAQYFQILKSSKSTNGYIGLAISLQFMFTNPFIKIMAYHFIFTFWFPKFVIIHTKHWSKIAKFASQFLWAESFGSNRRSCEKDGEDNNPSVPHKLNPAQMPLPWARHGSQKH